MVREKSKEVADKGKSVRFIPIRESKTGRLYSNFVSVSHSPWDFTIRFCDAPPGGDLAEIKDGAEVKIPTVAEVVIPATIMAGLIDALSKNYKRYVNAYGREVNEGIDKSKESKSNTEGSRR